MATDEEIEQQRAVLEQLRTDIEDAGRSRAEKERDAANEITMTQLLAEEARLRATLAERQAEEKRIDGDGARSPIQAELASLQRAVAIENAQTATVTDKPTPVDSEPVPTVPTTSVPTSPVTTTAKSATKQKGN